MQHVILRRWALFSGDGELAERWRLWRLRRLTISPFYDYRLREVGNCLFLGQPHDSRRLATGLTFWLLLSAAEAAPSAFTPQCFFTVARVEFANLFGAAVAAVGVVAALAAKVVAAVVAETASVAAAAVAAASTG